MNGLVQKLNKSKNDVIYTPLLVVKDMIEICGIKPTDSVLDCSAGDNKIFYNNFPDCEKSYCEITDGINFFEETKHYDLIIGNPPYSIWNKWLAKTIELTNKFCFIIGALNFTDARVRMLKEAGFGLTYFKILNIEWYFSCSYLVVFEKDKQSIIDVGEKSVLCECGKRCKRKSNTCGLVV